MVPDVLVGPFQAQVALSRWEAEGFTRTHLARATGRSQAGISKILNGRSAYVTSDTRAVMCGLTRAALLGVQSAPRTPVPVIGTRRRLEALAWMGWDAHSLRHTIDPVIWNGVLFGAGREPRLKTVMLATHQRVAETFRQLEVTRGPSDTMARVAAAKKWRPPLAWDDEDIDDPKAKPWRPQYAPGQYPVECREMFLADFDVLYGSTSPDMVAKQLGMTAEGVRKILIRSGRTREAREFAEATNRENTIRRARRRETA